MINELIEHLIDEHQIYNKKMKEFQKQLEQNFSNKLVEEIIHFLEKDIEDHAEKEENDLVNAILKVNPDYDEEAIIFGHNTIREAVEDLKGAYEDFQKGKATKEDIIKYANKAFTIIKDHFLEEENFLFPDIRRIEKEWL
jgi:hemerythrin-like domain-containing protein